MGATNKSLADVPDEEPEELDDELLLLEDDELDDEPELEDDELEEEELEDELDEELEEEELDDELPDDGPKAATESVSRLPLEDVQEDVVAPVFTAWVEPAPLLLEFGLSKRSIWPEPGVKEAFDAPLPTTSTSHEPEVATEIVEEIAVPEAAVLVVTASGPRCATPVREIAPALTPFTVPPNVT